MSHIDQKWVRSPNGLIAGVCLGLSQSLSLNVNLLRIAWLISVLFMGAGFWLYVFCAFALPRADLVHKANDGKILGVCAELARRFDLETGVVRLLALLLAVVSLGATLIGYIILYFVIDTQNK